MLYALAGELRRRIGDPEQPQLLDGPAADDDRWSYCARD